PLYELELPLREKIETIAREVYGADGVDYTPAAESTLKELEANGYGNLPVCMAKTQMSISVKSYILCKFVLVSGNGLMHFLIFY
ncbi:formate--tetrahydrofolate ligase, partial [Youngiibacter fragilis]|uniref:formate--tetrahydrofolate ligase n=1 Tax=Youngiibacter fragilis TaxID=1408819 RepID=UPI000593B6CD